MNKRDVVTKEDIEKYYSQCRRIKFAENIKPKNIKEIFDFIKERAEATFFKTGTGHCYHGRTRSIDDYINLCKTYFPETTLSEMIKVVKDNISNKINNRSVQISYCGNIKKENIRYTWYLNIENELANFEKRSFSKQGFPNCKLTYSQLS